MNFPPPLSGFQRPAGQAVPQMVATPQSVTQSLHQHPPGLLGNQSNQAQPGQINGVTPHLINQVQNVMPGSNGPQQGVAPPAVGTPNAAQAALVAQTMANANNPLYHPHQSDPSLLNSPIWKLQLQLAAVSRQSLGQSNVYARQNAMKKFLNSQNQGGIGGQAQEPSLNPMQQIQQSQGLPSSIPGHLQNGNDASMSLVEHTKQHLLELASSGNESTGPIPSNSTSNLLQDGTSSGISTPNTPKAELYPNTPSMLLQHKKLSQYNIDDDDEIEHRMVAPKDSKYNEQLWHALDLSNLALLNLSTNLFNYQFLTRLYLNGNNLTSVPPSIKKLTNLRVLDLSHNRLTELPSELGMCYQLKYLYFFDNMITTLPWEFGNLFNLQFLGCEGNPLDKKLVKILAEKSVTGLIFYLRDNAPEIPYSKGRKFIELSTDGEPTKSFDNLEESTDSIGAELLKRSFTLLSYNTLCQHYATPKMYRFTPSWALSWDYRREKLKEQLLKFDSDVICLQEVETQTYDEYWVPLMEKHDYNGLFHAKTRSQTMQVKDSKKVDGCAIFFKKEKFQLALKDTIDFSTAWRNHKKFQRTEDYLNRAMNKDNVALILKLKHVATNEFIWVVTTHLHWDPQFNDVKTFQVGILLDHMENLIKQHGHINNNSDLKKVPLLICGDFNSQLDSAVVELFTNGHVVSSHRDIDNRDFGYISQKNFSHNLSLKSAYEPIGELPFTNLTPSFTDVIDYIWYSTNSLRVRGLLGKVDEDYASKFIGFPNDKFPSDHIPLLTRFEITKSSNQPGGKKN